MFMVKKLVMIETNVISAMSSVIISLNIISSK